MDLITAKCPDCGADLKIAPGALNVVCDYCGSNILVTDVLGSGAVVQNCMTLAYAAMQGENFKDSFDQFNKALEHGSNNYNAWFGKAICAGNLSRVMDVRYDEMIVLFENAFTNAPADKQATLKRNAATEIVKAVKGSMAKIKMADQLLLQSNEEGGFSLNLGGFSSNTSNMKNEVFRALAKAREYDPANNDVIKLQSELGQTVKVSAANEPLVIHEPYPTLPQVQQMKPQVYGRKKNTGCAVIMAAIAILGVSLIIGIVLFSSGTKTTKNDNTITHQPLQKSYEYSIVKMTESSGSLSIAVYTDATDNDQFSRLNGEVLKKYSDKTRSFIINYYSNKAAAEKNGIVQSSRNEDWILKNASSIFLKATYEFDSETSEMKFYKYSSGKKVDIDANQIKVEPPDVKHK